MEYIKAHLLGYKLPPQEPGQGVKLEINKTDTETNGTEADEPKPETPEVETNKMDEMGPDGLTIGDLDTASVSTTCRNHRHHHCRRHHRHSSKSSSPGEKLLATSETETDNDRLLRQLLLQMPGIVRSLPELQQALLRYQELRDVLMLAREQKRLDLQEELESKIHHGESITPLRLQEREDQEEVEVSDMQYVTSGGSSRVVFAWPEKHQAKTRSLTMRFSCALFRLLALVLHTLALSHLLPETEYERSWRVPLKVTPPTPGKKQQHCTVIEPEWEQQ